MVSTLLGALAVAHLAGLAAPTPEADLQDQYCKARLFSGSTTLAPGHPFWVGVVFTLEPEWHIYWTNPGDSGIPTDVEWKLPAGFKADPLVWPAPKVFDGGGIVNHGYSGQVIAYAKITPPKDITPGSKVRIAGKASWMVCKEMCTLGSAELALSLSVSNSRSGGAANTAVTLRELLPPNRASQLPQVAGIANSAFSVDSESVTLEFGLPASAEPLNAHFFAADGGVIDNVLKQESVFKSSGNRVIGYLKLPKSLSLRKEPKFLVGVLAVEYSQNKKEAYVVKAPYRG